MTQQEFDGYHTIFIGTVLTDEQIKSGSGAFYGIESLHIIVDRNGNSRWWEQDLTNIALVCTVFEHPGEFPTQVELVLLDIETFSFPKNLTAIAQISSLLNAPCLVEDLLEPMHPYIWVLVQHGQPAKRVWVDDDMLNQEEYGFVIRCDVDGPPPLD